MVPAVASDGGLQVDPIDDLGQAKPDDPKAALYPFMGLANFYPPDDEITEEELPAIIHRVAKLGPGFFEHRYEVNLYRKRAAKLPPEEAQLASSLFEQYEHLIQSYETEADSAFSEAQDDFLLGAKFLVHDRAQGMPAPRPDGESHLATNCMLGMGPFVVDIGFRSADYPELNHLLGVMNAQRERLRTDLNVLLELQGLPQIGKHDARAR